MHNKRTTHRQRQIQESNTHTESFPGSHVCCCATGHRQQLDTYHSHFLRSDVSPYSEKHLLQTASLDHIHITTAMTKIHIAEGRNEIERRQVAAREEI